MKPFVFQARQDAYLEVLKWGLLAVREAAYGGHTTLCEIEADHIHNIPSLLTEYDMEGRHAHYLWTERMYYLDRLKQLEDEPYLHQRYRDFRAPWKVLEALHKERKPESYEQDSPAR